MTGSELVCLLIEKLQTALPQVKITESGKSMAVRGGGPVIAVGVEKETTGETHTAKLGFWLYTKDGENETVLYEAVCDALRDLPCAVMKTERKEAVQDRATGYMRTDCTAEAEWGLEGEPAEKLRFGGFVFPGMPESLQVKSKAMLRESVGINGEETVEQVGVFRRRVTVSGCFFGNEAEKAYETLEGMFGEEHTLFLPGRKPFAAVLDLLEQKGVPGRVAYRMGFTETAVPTANGRGRTYFAKGGESLWDYAYFTGVSIDILAKANPQIGHIGKLEAGEAVYIP